jgi:hypothetical protein
VGIWWEFGGNLVELSVPDYQGITSFFGNLVGIWWEFGGNLTGIWWEFETREKGATGIWWEFGGDLVGIWWFCKKKERTRRNAP